MNQESTSCFDRLLLIDDEPGIRRMMSLDLSADGYQVCTAEDGLSGLEAFRGQRPDIVLTDLKMPGMDGIEVLRRIKAESPETEVIVITGHGDLELAIQSLQLGASDFITKPVNDAALSVALKRAKEHLALKAQLKAHTQDLERRVAEATAKVVASERLAAVGQSISALVHSIKNILSGLKGGNYLVRQGLKTDKRHIIQQGLEMLERNVNRVASLCYDLLSFGKPRTPELAPVDLREICADAVEYMWPEAEAREVDLDLAERAQPLVCQVDRKAVMDAILNLVSNAIDAAASVNDGQVRIAVEEGEDHFALAVSDNGPGLDEEAQRKVFQGFYSSKGAAGTGLGLMVCQKIAQEHGGRLELDNRPGQGATFRLLLPRRVAEPVEVVKVKEIWD
ncbi:MAG: response regulator [Pseudomonadota bacterium]